jgi:hypothetical protein
MQSCLYTATGSLICPPKKSTIQEQEPIVEHFEICPPGSWMRTCDLKCNGGIMTGKCDDKPVNRFSYEKCAKKDIYYSFEARKLKCDSKKS